jgi:hypothetical protein
MSVHTTPQEEVMGKAIPAQHPAVVLRSHYRHLRALLAVALIAVVGLTVALVILATDRDQVSVTSSASPAAAPLPQQQPLGIRYDGGPEEGTTGMVRPGPAEGIRYDGGPEEGTAALTQRSAPVAFDSNSIEQAPGVRYDGGPEEGTSGALTVPNSPSARYDGGPEEGSWAIGR